MSEVFIRLFIQADTKQAAEIAERIRERLKHIASRVLVTVVRPYWKIAEYQEVCLSLCPPDDATCPVSTTTSALGAGWIVEDDGEAIWNAGENAAFVEPLVRWVHVEQVEEVSRVV